MKLAKSAVALSIALSINTAYSSAVSASQEAFEVIEVKSDFRAVNLQTVSSSLSVLSSDDIALRNAQNLEEVIALAANVNFSSGSQRARYYQIRGIGERSQFQEPINPSVGIIIDDVDFTGVGSVSSMFDVGQTEIYRGPQGTRFGANALAGLINIRTNAPTDDFEGQVKLQLGNYHSQGAGVALSGPAADGVNYRVALEQYKSDGFIENTHLNKSDTHDRDELTARAKLAIEVSSDLSIDLAGYYFDFDNGYDAFSLDNTRETLSDEPGKDQQETYALSAKANYTGNNHAEMVAVVSHINSDLTYGYDEDWAFVGIHPWEYSSVDNYLRDKQSSTAEFRVLSTTNSQIFNGSTSWVAGVYLKTEKEDLTRQYTYLASDFSSTFETDTSAIYVQFESRLADKLTLTSGLRYERRTADYENSDAFTFDPSDDMFGGKLVLSYQQSSETLIYGSVNRGYKAGGVNTDGTLPDELRTFEAEYLWNYELGFKTSFAGGDGYLRSALFYMDRQDMQVKSSKSVSRPDGSSEFIIYLGNAAKGSNYGVELDSGYQVTEDLEVYGSLGLLNTELEDFINQDGIDISGRDQAHASSYQFNIGVNYYLTETLLFNVSVEGKDEFYFSDSHDQESNAIELVNASVTYQGDNWQVKAWGRNITDKDYATRGFYFGNDPRDSYTAKPYYQYGEPAVFGVTVNYQF